MHILYQNALDKNGMPIHGVVIIGVKPVDLVQCQYLDERLKNQGFLPLLPLATGRTVDPIPHRSSSNQAQSILLCWFLSVQGCRCTPCQTHDLQDNKLGSFTEVDSVTCCSRWLIEFKSTQFVLVMLIIVSSTD
ncbi:hypothetical protein MLD38_030215 [Melastoma candidum]|uniref:Uncharacterized protein n=1 Tax=Melastoma candidum TaxID=119954 RepID=A0ACB9ML39_9MYRT|nr:hypothetical protein MLD38_030215 [Melastoma candidum]